MTPHDTAPAPTEPPAWRPTDLVHLMYLGLLVFQPIFDPAGDLGDWLLVAAVIAVFVPFFVWSLRMPPPARWWEPAVGTALGLAASPFNSGASVLFVFAAAAAGNLGSRREALRWFVGLTVLVSVLFALSPVPMPWRLWSIFPPVLLIWVIGLGQVEEAEREREAAALRVQRLHVEHLATLAERERIARDLHDLLGHSLTGIVVRAQLAQQLAGTDPERSRAEAEAIERTARDALSEVRAVVSGWRRATLDAELQAATETLTAAGIELVVQRDEGLTIVGSTEHELALALREAITNVARHAAARTCRVSIGTGDDEVRVVVADDGRGGRAAEGGGLRGIRERIGALGGRVERVVAGGTTLTIAVPLRVAA